MNDGNRFCQLYWNPSLPSRLRTNLETIPPHKLNLLSIVGNELINDDFLELRQHLHWEEEKELEKISTMMAKRLQ